MVTDVYLMGLVVVAGHGGVGAISLHRQVCSGSYPSDLAVRRTGPWRSFLARLSPLELAAVMDMALVVEADAGTPARAPSPRKGRRPEPLDRAARWPKLHAVPARGAGRR